MVRIYERVSSLEHTNAQTLLGMKGTKVQYVRVDFGSNPLSDQIETIFKKI